MQYKKLTEEDFRVGYQPIITEMKNSPVSKQAIKDGTDVQNFHYRQVANIIQGDTTSNLPIGSSTYVHSFERIDFKESIHPDTFDIGGVRLKTASIDVNYCDAGREYEATDGSYYLYPDVGIVLKNASSITFKGCSEEINTTAYVYIRARNKEFNYSTNPSFSDINGNIRFALGKDNPVVYITTVGLYNDNGDLLAVAKVPTPIKKTFHDEVLIQIQLDF